MFYKYKILIFLLFLVCSQLAWGSCNFLVDVDSQLLVVSKTKQFVIYKDKGMIQFKTEEFKKHLEETIEVYVDDDTEFGHAQIRIGKFVYSYHYVKSMGNSPFDIYYLRSREYKGVVFKLDSERVEFIHNEMRKLVKSGQQFNIPPYDIVGAKEEMLFDQNGRPYLNASSRLLTTRGNIVNTSPLLGEIQEIEDGKHQIVSQNGFTYEIEKKGEKYYIQTVQCSTLVTYILKRFLGITIDKIIDPVGLLKILTSEKNAIQPEMVIHYGYPDMS